MSDLYVVTGGLGFIGSNMVKFLNSIMVDRPDVVVCDNVTPDKYKNISGLRVANIIKQQELFEFVESEKPNGIFHLGACSDTMNFHADYVMTKNFEFTRALIDQCLDLRVPLVYASSASVYGTLRLSDEELTGEPLNLYAFSKTMIDQYLRAATKNSAKIAKSCRPSIVGMRYFNVYGPNERHKGRMASVIFQKYLELKEKGYIKLFKPGDQQRDFVHVDDVCKVNWAAMKSEVIDIFNVGTSFAPTFTAVAEEIAKCMGYEDSKSIIKYIDFPKELEGRYQDYTCSDNTRLKQIYDGTFTPYYTGIRKAISAYEAGL